MSERVREGGVNTVLFKIDIGFIKDFDLEQYRFRTFSPLSEFDFYGGFGQIT